MRNLLVAVVLAIISFTVISCDGDEKAGVYEKNPFNSEVKGFYEAPHPLRKMFAKEVSVKEPSSSSLDAGFFLFIGGASGKSTGEREYQVTRVRFAWEIKDSVYVFTTLPLDKVRIKLSEKADIPTASFVLSESLIKQRFDEIRKPCRYVIISGIDDARKAATKEKALSDSKEAVESSLGNPLRDYMHPNEVFERYLDYVVITVKEKDWPKNINLPSGDFP